ncbi:AMP-binding protein [Clostridium yunnanense]|uniref:AMP-binding protein n=1 Tax=Clostridium yunnanense TaxID=2800325 RepID=UPI00190663BC|nr:AMP-binding protein [Clostridium yunnanense]
MFYNIGIDKGKLDLDTLRIIVISGQCVNWKVSEKLIKAFSKAKVVENDDSCVINVEVEELLIQGSIVMKSYWNDQEKTNEKIKNGWLHTSDLAYKDKDSFIYIKGRLDDMIIKAGVNIYLQEIEAILL